MKLFSEYYAGHISHNFYLFGEDDIKFLEQFPQELWNRAIKQRYYADLPKALLAREEARNTKTLPNLTDLQGNPTNDKYYELIQKEADRVNNELTQIHNPTNARTRQRISQMAYNKAKNEIDSMLSERKDKGGPWMEVKTVRRNYNFNVLGRHGSKTITQSNVRSYIPELVRRIEGPKGSSPIGYDLSKIEKFDPAISDEQQNGGWRTLGFYCPQKDVISDNLQAWIGYASQGLLDEPGSIENQEEHRNRPKEKYAANKQAREEFLDDTIYKNPLRNYYTNYITRLKEILKRDGDISDEELEILYDRFARPDPLDDERYAYRKALRGTFADHLESTIGTGDAHELDHDQLVEMIQACVGVNVPFERALANALADIDLITHSTPNYHDRDVDHEASSEFKVLTKEGPHGKIPDLKGGKILYHVETVRRKLQAKLDKATSRLEELELARRELTNQASLERNQIAINRVQNEIDQLNDLMTNIFERRGVGHHYNMGDILENPNLTPEERQRQKVFLQFNNEREVPEQFDKRDRVLGGGIYPHKNMPQAKGPGRSNIGNAMQNLNRYLADPNSLRELVARFISDNYEGKLNILFKVFSDGQGNPTDANTYKLFVDLIKDQCLRNIGLFDIEGANNKAISSQIKKIISHTCNRLVEKEVGEAGPVRQRQGEEANAADVRAVIRDMLTKTQQN